MTTGSTAQEFDAYTLFDDVPYGTAMLNGTETILHAALYLPNSYSAPPPLLQRALFWTPPPAEIAARTVKF